MENNTSVAPPQDFTPEQVNQLRGHLPQILSERTILEKQFNEIILLDITEKSTQESASALRKLIVKNRTQGIEKWHTTTKNYFLRGGQFVDAIKRKEVESNKRMEDTLSEIENYELNKRKKMLEELKSERLLKLGDSAKHLPIGVAIESLSESDFKYMVDLCFTKTKQEQEAAEAEQKRIKEEQEELKRLRAIAAEKQKEEQKIKAEEKKMAKANDGDKLRMWINNFSIPTSPINSQESEDIVLKFNAFKQWALKQIK
jgi:hypothetical protein